MTSSAPESVTTAPATSTRWSMIGAIAATLSVVALVVAVVVVVRGTHAIQDELRTAHEQEEQALAAIRDAVRGASSATWIGLKASHHVCLADNSATTCVVTNPTDAPIATCFRGTLTQKKARGVHLTSMVACTGRIGPHETKSVAAVWSGGFARDVCSSTNRFGTEMLDWEQCEFAEDPVELDALARLVQPPK
jgi:hypothetical protein